MKVDEVWKQKFLERVKRTMIENDIYEEELENRFVFYDQHHSGVVSQVQFKDVMNGVGIILTLPELIKAVRSLGTNKNEIKYVAFVEKLKSTEVTEVGRQEITFEEFLKKIE